LGKIADLRERFARQSNFIKIREISPKLLQITAKAGGFACKILQKGEKL